MSPRPIALAALAILACTSAESPPEAPKPVPAPIEPASEPVEPAPEPAPAPAPAPLPASTRPWVWYHAYPAVLADALSQVGTGPVAHDHRVGDRRRYTARRDGPAIELIRERLPEPGAKGEPVPVWRRRVEAIAAIGEPVVQASMGEPAEVVVAWRIPDGYARHAFADDGAPRSSAIVLDPPGFPSRGAALQLGGWSERPAVHVRGTDRAYLDELDLATGQPIARASFGPEVLHDRFPWPPDGPRGRRFGHRWPAADGGRYQVRRRGDAVELWASDSTGNERWRTVLDPKRGPWWSSAALLEQGEHVIVVAYDGITSGASVHGVDRERGTLRFSTSPGGIGNIGHSMYSNDVGLSLGDDGLVRVHGHESAGDYLGVIDPKAGRLLGHEVWRR